jgi:hypothetical protein
MNKKQTARKQKAFFASSKQSDRKETFSLKGKVKADCLIVLTLTTWCSPFPAGAEFR